SVAAGVHHQLHPVPEQPGAHGTVPSLRGLIALLRELAQRQAPLAREGRAAAGGAVGRHRQHAVAPLDQVAQVRAPAGEEDPERDPGRPGHRKLTRGPAERSTTRPTTGYPGIGSAVTSTMPRPILNVETISSASTRPRRATRSKMGGTFQAERSSSAASPSGRARGTLST